MIDVQPSPTKLRLDGLNNAPEQIRLTNYDDGEATLVEKSEELSRSFIRLLQGLKEPPADNRRERLGSEWHSSCVDLNDRDKVCSPKVFDLSLAQTYGV